ncbi:MAG: hypothetical protein JKY27_03710 [Magnetovibrio sp.]|nr:hypothetical protein [Magnetovibrio sp.]
MNEKFTAHLVTFAIVGPICALCILGPVLFAALFAGAGAWLSGVNPVIATAIAIISAILIFAYIRRKFVGKAVRKSNQSSPNKRGSYTPSDNNKMEHHS